MTKFRRWFLSLFGGVPKSDYNIVVEQRDNFINDLKINNSQIKKLQEENELLKNQIARNPTTPVILTTQTLKLKEINKVASIGSLPLEQTEFCLRQAVLAEVAPFIKIEHKPSNQTVTATLLLAAVEELAISKECKNDK